MMRRLVRMNEFFNQEINSKNNTKIGKSNNKIKKILNSKKNAGVLTRVLFQVLKNDDVEGLVTLLSNGVNIFPFISNTNTNTNTNKNKSKNYKENVDTFLTCLQICVMYNSVGTMSLLFLWLNRVQKHLTDTNNINKSNNGDILSLFLGNLQLNDNSKSSKKNKKNKDRKKRNCDLLSQLNRLQMLSQQEWIGMVQNGDTNLIDSNYKTNQHMNKFINGNYHEYTRKYLTITYPMYIIPRHTFWLTKRVKSMRAQNQVMYYVSICVCTCNCVWNTKTDCFDLI